MCIRTYICKDDYNMSMCIHVFITFYTFLRIIIIIHETDFMKFSRINQYIHSIPRVLFKLIKKNLFFFLAR